MHGARARPAATTSALGTGAASRYYQPVTVNRFFKGVARVTRTFRLKAGPFQAEGPPAVLIALTGVLAMVALVKAAERFPESLREARMLATALRGEERPRLQP